MSNAFPELTSIRRKMAVLAEVELEMMLDLGLLPYHLVPVGLCRPDSGLRIHDVGGDRKTTGVQLTCQG